MLKMMDRRPTVQTIDGWATSVLLEAGAIREYKERGWMKDRTDPHARQRAVKMACEEPPPGISQDQAVAAIESVLSWIGDTCPECPPNSG